MKKSYSHFKEDDLKTLGILFLVFNDRNGQVVPIIYGVITNGYEWLFLKLEQQIHSVTLCKICRLYWVRGKV